MITISIHTFHEDKIYNKICDDSYDKVDTPFLKEKGAFGNSISLKRLFDYVIVDP